jgi:DNA-binding CsgD family transcriptional regulator
MPKKIKKAKSHATHFHKLADRYSLSPMERQVASYVIEGLTNKEIAKKLGNSPITVGVHLTRAYKKSGVRTRTELAWLMSRGVKTKKKASRPRAAKKKVKKKLAKKAKSKWKRKTCAGCSKRLQEAWNYCPKCGKKRIKR